MWTRVLLVLLAVVVATASAAAAAATRFEARFEASVAPFLEATADSLVETLRARGAAVHTPGRTEWLPDVAKVAREAHRRHALIVDLDHLRRFDECDDCKAEALPLQQAFKSDRFKDLLSERAKNLCARLELFSPMVCNGTIDLFTDIFIEVVAHSRLEPLEVCGDAGVCVVEAAPSWNVTFPREKPPVRSTPAPLPTSRRAFVLHLTDLHFDPDYTAGLEADCGDPICCRPPNPVGTRRVAGPFGDYRCDAPLALIDDMLDFIANRGGLPAIDYILLSGDLTPDDVWASTQAGYIDLMETQARLLVDYFPGIVVVPAIGNHESVPIDQFPPRSVDEPEYSISWLYDALAEQWGRWLPESALVELRRAGNFDVLLQPGLRAVSVNDEGCSGNNFWLRMLKETGCCKYEYADPDNTLHWLVSVLQAAEDAGERVLLVRHVPNASRCNAAWSLNYHKIMTRYESTVVAMFTGHFHSDQFDIYYRDEGRTEAAVVNYVGPSATPFTDVNPGFRLYELDLDTFDVVNTYTYVANLTAANAEGRLTWTLEYTAAQLYGLTRLGPQDWHDVALRLGQDPNLFDQYYSYKFKGYLNGRTCTGACVASEVCGLRTSYVGQPPCEPSPSL